MLKEFILTTILKDAQEREASGQFSVFWVYTPQSGLGLTVRKRDGTLLYASSVTSQAVRELLSSLLAVVTREEKPSTSPDASPSPDIP